MVGITNPDLGVAKITRKDMYDYDEGDVFQYVDFNSEMFSCYSNEKFYQKKILNKEVSQNGDTVSYLIHLHKCK